MLLLIHLLCTLKDNHLLVLLVLLLVQMDLLLLRLLNILMFGKRGAIDMVVQSARDMFIRPEPRNRGMNIMGTSLYGIKTFTDGAEQLVQMRVTA